MALLIRFPKVHFRNPDISPEVSKWKGAVIHEMARYPPQKPWVRYRRRGSAGYGGHWRFALERDSALVFNDMPYAQFLGGDDYPDGAAKWARAYGWKSVREVGKRHAGPLEEAVGKKLRASIRFDPV